MLQRSSSVTFIIICRSSNSDITSNTNTHNIRVHRRTTQNNQPFWCSKSTWRYLLTIFSHSTMCMFVPYQSFKLITKQHNYRAKVIGIVTVFVIVAVSIEFNNHLRTRRIVRCELLTPTGLAGNPVSATPCADDAQHTETPVALSVAAQRSAALLRHSTKVSRSSLHYYE